MNCFSINTRLNRLSRGISVDGIDGVGLGKDQIVPFSRDCLADPQKHLSKMIFETLLVDADLSGGEVTSKISASTNNLVMLTIGLTGDGEGSVKISDANQSGKIENVVGPVVYVRLEGTDLWTREQSILLSVAPFDCVSIEWTTKRRQPGWFFKKERLEMHAIELTIEDGKPKLRARL
jgi:hypothetical protein